MVEIQLVFEILILIAAIVIITYAIFQSTKILNIISGSKIEPVWRQARLLTILLYIFFFFFAIVRILATLQKNEVAPFTLNDTIYNLGIGKTHNLMMNSSFLLTSLLLLILFRIDSKAYSALFDLISEK